MAERERITCVKHNADLLPSNFYLAGESSVFAGIGRIPICKGCLYKMAESYYAKYQDMALSIYYMCRKIDIAYDSNIYEGALKQGDHDIVKVFQSYMRQFNSIGAKNDSYLPFDYGEHLSSKVQQKTTTDDDSEVVNIDSYDVSEEEIRESKEEVIRLIEYDPFEGFSYNDQKFLYSDLLNYLRDEDVIEDQFLVSQIVQIVNNNNQVRKIDYLLSQYMASDKLMKANEARIKSLNATKKDIVGTTDKIAKENRISVKGRKGNVLSKNSLTALMDRLRSIDLKEAEVNFYDQKKAYGMQRAADISMRAMAEQIQFDENDVNHIITEQRRMIADMEHKVLDLEEKNRILHTRLLNMEVDADE